ncbi:hypothetical protein FQR65_LT20755 [Abscondita terminalis]|nr:hypothetical protein FQR65_LT20755 [Abscondita terminalis]
MMRISFGTRRRSHPEAPGLIRITKALWPGCAAGGRFSLDRAAWADIVFSDPPRSKSSIRIVHSECAGSCGSEWSQRTLKRPCCGGLRDSPAREQRVLRSGVEPDVERDELRKPVELAPAHDEADHEVAESIRDPDPRVKPHRASRAYPKTLIASACVRVDQPRSRQHKAQEQPGLIKHQTQARRTEPPRAVHTDCDGGHERRDPNDGVAESEYRTLPRDPYLGPHVTRMLRNSSEYSRPACSVLMYSVRSSNAANQTDSAECDREDRSHGSEAVRDQNS